MINTIKTSKTLRLAIVSAGLVLGMAHQSAFALGTASNTDINNFAKVSYTVGGVAQNDICSSPTGNNISTGSTSLACSAGVGGSNAAVTTFKVDNKVNLLVAEADGAPTIVVPGDTNRITTFQVTNLGNTAQDYFLSVNNSIASAQTIFTPTVLTDNFDATNCAVFVESGTTAGFQAAEDTATVITSLAADATKVVYAKCDIPVTRLNNDVSIVELTATTRTAGSAGLGVLSITANTQAGVEIVLADAATVASADGTRPLQTAGDGIGFARDAYKVESAILGVTKVATPICDPINAFGAGPKNIPGAAVQYAVTITNTGLAAATLTTITDTLDASLSFPSSGVAGGAGNACVPAPVLTNGFGAVKSATLTTTYAAPGLAAESTTAGTTVAGQLVTINYATLATSTITAPAAATLAPGASITVYFNAFVK
jgi:uncharacterized repeat protein (TIGR01451 family)